MLTYVYNERPFDQYEPFIRLYTVRQNEGPHSATAGRRRASNAHVMARSWAGAVHKLS